MANLYPQYPAKHTWRNGPKKGTVVTISNYRPELYPQGVGEYYIGEIAGYTYVPAMNGNKGGYREGGAGSPKDPNDKPGIWEQVKPIATTGGAFAATQSLLDPTKRGEFLKGVGTLPGDIYEGVTGAADSVYNFGKDALDDLNLNDLYDFGKRGVQDASDYLNGLLEGSDTPAQVTEAVTNVPGATSATSAGAPAVTSGLLDGVVTATADGGAILEAGAAIPEGFQGVATMADGTTKIAPVAEQGVSILGDVVAPAAAAYFGTQNAIEGFEEGNEVQAGLGTAGAAWGAAGLMSTAGLLSSNPVTLPVGAAVAAIAGILAGTGVLEHKSTKEYHAERVGRLGPAGQDYFNKAASLAAQDPNNGTWTDGKYAGQKWTFEKAQDLAKDDPTHFIGNMGNFDTFGDGWTTTPYEKQKNIVSRLIDEGLYVSNKGDVMIDHENQARAKEIYNEEMGITEEEDENA